MYLIEDDNRTEGSEDSDRTLTPTQNIPIQTLEPPEPAFKESAINKISIRLHHFKFDLPQSFSANSNNTNATTTTNSNTNSNNISKPNTINYYNNFSASKTMSNNPYSNLTNKSKSASVRQHQTGSPYTQTSTTSTTTPSISSSSTNCNFILKSISNLDNLALLNSTILMNSGINGLASADTHNNHNSNQTNNQINNQRPNSQLELLSADKKPSVRSQINSIAKVGRSLPVKKVSLCKATEPTKLLSGTMEMSGPLADTIQSNTDSSAAFDPHKLSYKTFESSLTQSRYFIHADFFFVVSSFVEFMLAKLF